MEPNQDKLLLNILNSPPQIRNLVSKGKLKDMRIISMILPQSTNEEGLIIMEDLLVKEGI